MSVNKKRTEPEAISEEELQQIAKRGHNQVGDLNTKKLKSGIERIENLNDDKAGILDDIRTVFAEMKGAGFDVKAIRACIKLRAMKANEREEQEYVLDVYKRALGLIPELDETI